MPRTADAPSKPFRAAQEHMIRRRCEPMRHLHPFDHSTLTSGQGYAFAGVFVWGFDEARTQPDGPPRMRKGGLRMIHLQSSINLLVTIYQLLTC